ncbi:thioredoxin [Halococcus morrhuae DSM 1307]|uniref:Thioredoxin n=1 Tax=Halococcus morrhuae DSM 1307 TaxID=931277 RepID=M0N3A5_HALMO|nr:thioredoxin domain-containing protein [Halococcus morrhuae]EMA51998.1 thioredoxin [Halococcus morrhuae DSM 1307]
MELRRRAFLASAVATSTLAGCLGSGDTGSADTADGTDGSDGNSSGSGSTSRNGSTAAAGTAAPALDHPAATALAGQPFRGPAPGTAPGTIIAFEDPSCHNCRRFNEDTLPAIESKLVEPGEATFVYRNFPHAFAWGEPAMQALEATFARGEAPFWALEGHYFATQEEFSEENVLDRTEEFLAAETAVDASAVVADAEAKKFDEAFQRDADAGDAAGVVSTPTFYLFRDGEFLTEVRGAQSYQVFARALGVE